MHSLTHKKWPVMLPITWGLDSFAILLYSGACPLTLEYIPSPREQPQRLYCPLNFFLVDI